MPIEEILALCPTYESVVAHMDNCPHDAEPRRLECSNGTVQIKEQCKTCGQAIGNPISHAKFTPDDIAAMPLFDRHLQSDWWESHRQAQSVRMEEEGERRKAEWEEGREERARRYAEYLDSPKWERIRRQKLRMTGGMCEGCGNAGASHVHHLSYANVGDELLFQLVTLCEPCHQKWHWNGPYGEPRTEKRMPENTF